MANRNAASASSGSSSGSGGGRSSGSVKKQANSVGLRFRKLSEQEVAKSDGKYKYAAGNMRGRTVAELGRLVAGEKAFRKGLGK